MYPPNGTVYPVNAVTYNISFYMLIGKIHSRSSSRITYQVRHLAAAAPLLPFFKVTLQTRDHHSLKGGLKQGYDLISFFP